MIHIRLLRKMDDFIDLIALSRSFFNEYEAYHKEFFMIDELSDDAVIGYFANFCASVSRKAFIALDGGRIVGYLTAYVKEQADYWRVKKFGEISGLMIHKEYRRQRIAERLLMKAKEFFSNAGLEYYTVYTAVANQAALDFYQKNGMIPLYATLIGETQEISGR